jgi:hypothetical protein
MHTFILWVGCVGAWALVAGPVFQAAVELSEQELDRAKLAAIRDDVGPPPDVSRWWWLIPPVKYVLERRAGKRYRDEVFAALPAEDRADYVDYMNKATGWLLVAFGGLCIAAKETWELLEHYHLHVWVWVLVMIGLFVASASYAAAGIGRSDEMKGQSPRRPSHPLG